MPRQLVNIDNATVNILIDLDGLVYMVATKKDNLDAISFLCKRAVESVIPTGKSQTELNEFLNYKE